MNGARHPGLPHGPDRHGPDRYGPDRYGADVLTSRSSRRPSAPEVDAERDLVVEDAASGFCGAVVAIEKGYDGLHVRLEDRHGRTRLFAMRPSAFLLDGIPVTLVRPVSPTREPQRRTASGSRAVSGHRARTARASRLFVEGVHDAELIEQVWGADLRVEGVVVVGLDGLDNLADVLRDFEPDPRRRAGVLVDHLVTGSKEERLTASVGEHVLVRGHPYVDIWQAVTPAAVGIHAWPSVPRSQDWKTGVCARLGWGEPRTGWRRVRNAVNDFRDLETPLVRAVEELIDFVTVDCD